MRLVVITKFGGMTALNIIVVRKLRGTLRSQRTSLILRYLTCLETRAYIFSLV